MTDKYSFENFMTLFCLRIQRRFICMRGMSYVSGTASETLAKLARLPVITSHDLVYCHRALDLMYIFFKQSHISEDRAREEDVSIKPTLRARLIGSQSASCKYEIGNPRSNKSPCKHLHIYTRISTFDSK